LDKQYQIHPNEHGTNWIRKEEKGKNLSFFFQFVFSYIPTAYMCNQLNLL